MRGASALPPTPEVQLLETLLDWWRPSELRRRRDALPWREHPEPWPVLVSEVMLAQTSVARVLPRFGPFVTSYDTPARLAASALRDVLAHFDGLGYPRRALALREAAARIDSDHHGEVPDDEAALQRLPGVGSYTARAVLAFAFDRPVLPIDTNVGRVLARALAGSPLTQKAAASTAARISTVAATGRETARAVMDLGAELCRPRHPSCGSCPLAAARACSWQKLGGADPAPRSFAVSKKQAAYAGSDRQGRGRLLRAAAAGHLECRELATVAGWPDDPSRAERLVKALVAEGLLAELEGGYVLGS